MSEANSLKTDMCVLRVISLNKTFGRREVVKEVPLDANGGEIVGLLGPNGAVKPQPSLWLRGLCLPLLEMSFWINST